MHQTSLFPASRPVIRVGMPLAELILEDGSQPLIHRIWALRRVLGVDFVEAARLTAAARRDGRVFCRKEPLEHAEFYRDRLAAFGLMLVLRTSPTVAVSA